MSFSKGDIVDGYRISLLLKQGETSETYRARNEAGKLVVMKFGVSEFERKLLAKTDLFIGQTDRYIVMRHIPGETLSMRLRREQKLLPETVLRIAGDIVSQLCVCHEAGFAHNGLTIENVFLDLSEPNIRAYLTGYGKAAESSDFSADCIAVGKILYYALYGEEQAGPIKIPATTDKDSERLCALMVNALSGEFKSASMMKECLYGKESPTVVRKPIGPGFSAVAGMECLKKLLREDVIDILTQSEEAKKYGLTIPNGMLLYGPPGCGKTFIAEKFAEEAAYNYKYVKTSDLASVYLHGSQTKIAELFDEARKNAPTILCLDEFDALVPSRDNLQMNASQSAEINEFLSQMNNCGQDGVFVIATTNRPDKIDSAILRSGRIDYKIYVPVPDFESRKAIFSLALKDRPCEDNIDFDSLAKDTEGYLASDITSVVQTAAREAFRSKSLISNTLLTKALQTAKPSMTKAQLLDYERMKDKFESDNTDQKRSVGFF